MTAIKNSHGSYKLKRELRPKDGINTKLKDFQFNETLDTPCSFIESPSLRSVRSPTRSGFKVMQGSSPELRSN